MNRQKTTFSIFIVLVLILSVGVARLLVGGKQPSVRSSAKDSMTKGNPKASIQIVEFTDFQCPACAKGTEVLHDFFQLYPQSLYLVFKNFPLDMHPHALSIAIAGECAAQQKKFWAFHDLAFGRQNLLRETINLTERLRDMANEAHLNVNRFERCLADPAVLATVTAERKEGRERKVAATPTYFVNGKMIVGGGNLRQELEGLLGRLP